MNHWQTKWLAMDVSKSTFLATANDVVEAYCGRWFRNNPVGSLLVLCGEVRTGKTHLAKRIAWYAAMMKHMAFESGKWGATKVPNVHLFRWPEVANELNEKNRSFMDDALSASMLVLDDVGAENDPWKICADALCQVLSRREKMFTVITTNVMPTSWGEKFDARICDRLLRNSTVVDLSGVKPYVANGGANPTAQNAALSGAKEKP